MDNDKPMWERACTTLDHIYPAPKWGKEIKKGTPCYCGKRQWGVEPTPKLKETSVGTVQENHDDDDAA